MKYKHTVIYRYALYGILGLLLHTNIGFAQPSYLIEGIVQDDANGEPVIGASVQIKGTDFGTITDIEGKYALEASLNSGEYILVFRFLGYLTEEVTVNLSTQRSITINTSLATDILNLEELVVTGTSVATSKRQLGNAISSISNQELSRGAAIAADQALSGKVAGALVQQNSGDPAGGISIRLRGASTITGNSDPLYIVDGVIVNNSSTEVIDLGGTSQNRLVDINPNDIERIEVIKGAAAAAIYGSRASNGVVQIFTRKGTVGKPKISFSTSLNINQLRKQIDYNQVPLVWENPFDNNNLNTNPAQRFNYQDDFFETSLGTENFLSISGGTDRTRYFLSGSYMKNGGIIKNTDFERYGLRVNLDQTLNDWLVVKGGISYTQSNSTDIPNGGINAAYGAITGFLFSENSINPKPNEFGVYPVTSLVVARTNPLEAVARFKFGQRTNRTISNLGLQIFPVKKLNITYVLGMDFTNQSGSSYIPPINTSTIFSGFAQKGEFNKFQFNNDLNFSFDTEIGSKWNSTTVLGGTWQYERSELLRLASDRLGPFAQVSSGGVIIEQTDVRGEISFWGGFLQQTFGFRNKLFLTGAIRLDGASVFGENERNQIYGKASLSYLLSDESFWENTFGKSWSNFKIRVSWGQAGNLTALGPFDRFTLYRPFAVTGQPAAVPGAVTTSGAVVVRLGNEPLKPERQEEFEVGFDATFIDDRIGLEFTYYSQRVEDLLLERELAPSTEFETRFENVGALKNNGIELMLKAVVLRTNKLEWDIVATYSSNKNEVTRVIGERITLPGSFSTSFVIPGEPLGVFYRQFYARDENGNILLDNNGLPSTGVTEDGQTSKVIGDPNPDWFGSLISDFRYGKFSFRLQFDAVQGFDVFNWNRRLMDNVIFGGGPKVGQELNGELPKGFGRAQANIFEEFVENGSFVKFRELSLSYMFTPKTNSISNILVSFIGRNLVSFDDYSSWDPEINTPGQSNGVRGFDFAGVPIPRTYQIKAAFSF